MVTQTNELSECCMGCGGCILGLGLVGSMVSLYVFSIMGLCETPYKDVDELCPESNLWYFLLVLLIMNLSSGKSAVKRFSDDSDSSNGCAALISLFIHIGYISWGTYEVFGVSCIDQLHDTLLWKASFASVVATWSVLGVAVLIMITLFLASMCKINRSNGPNHPLNVV
jgi:hypothetical protein